MLEERFRLPAYINNNGDLFAHGEATAGFCRSSTDSWQAGHPKRYRNLFGITGTGLGDGIVRNGEPLLGDNSAGGDA